MYRHHCLTDELEKTTVLLRDEAARHLGTVLRVVPGKEVQLFDGKGRTRLYTVTAAEKKQIDLSAIDAICEHPPMRSEIVLYACISKGERMDWLVEKAVELGAARIVPVISDRSVVRLKPEERAAKRDRWMRIVGETAKQCGAVWLPVVEIPLPLRELKLAGLNFVAALKPDAGPIRFDGLPDCVGFITGPEGDFTDGELDYLIGQGAIPVTLGPLVLRAETAAIYGLSVLRHLTA